MIQKLMMCKHNDIRIVLYTHHATIKNTSTISIFFTFSVDPQLADEDVSDSFETEPTDGFLVRFFFLGLPFSLGAIEK